MTNTYNSAAQHHRSIRLTKYDYNTEGAYFVTICTHQRMCTLGTVREETMYVNTCGKAVIESWNNIPAHFVHVSLDAFVVMPDHVHGIIVITHAVAATHASPQRSGPASGGLGAIVGSFKSAATRLINAPRPFWQRNYYEHIIRNEDDLNHIRTYIEQNPVRWHDDRFHLP